MSSYQKLRLILSLNPKKLGKFWHLCRKCGYKQYTKKLRRNCKKCKNRYTVFFVGLDGAVYPEFENIKNGDHDE